MVRPSHTKRAFVAQRVFTDREHARQTFLDALIARQRPEDYRVLVFYGVGGQGKTALCHEFQRVLAMREKYKPIGCATINFDNPTHRTIDEALLSIRLQLGRRAGLRFPAFDTAFARYFALDNPGVQMRDRHPELFRAENDIIEDVVDAAGTALSQIPGVGLIYKLGARHGSRLWGWWQARGREVLVGLDDLQPYELLNALPKYLGADIHDGLSGEAAASAPRICVLIDAYEALWRDRGLKQGPGALRVDEWVRRLVQETPGALFVLFGRERLRWGELDAEWDDILDQHLLGGLADADADRFLRAVPIPEDAIRTTIVEAAKGLPFYLDLQVSTYETLRHRNVEPTPAHFVGTGSEIIARFLDHLEGEDERVLRLAAHARWLDEPLFLHLCERFLGGPAVASFARLGRHSFMERDEAGRLTMHALMRDELLRRNEAEQPELNRQIHECLLAWHDERARVETVLAMNPEAEASVSEAAYHLALLDGARFRAWCGERTQVYADGARYSLLESIREQALATAEEQLGPNDVEVGTWLQKLAMIRAWQGRYRDAEPLYERALRITEAALGPEHPDVGGCLESLAMLHSRQGRYREAEPLLQRALRITVAELEPEHPDVAERLSALASLYVCQGRYDEAEPLDQRALRITEAALGPEHPAVGTRLNSLAVLYLYRGRPAEAEPLCERALRIAEAAVGPEHPVIGNRLDQLASLYSDQGRYSDAKPLYERALRITEATLGPEHPDVGTCLNNLGSLYHDQGRYAEAEPLYERALQITEAALGPEHPDVGTRLHNVANLYHDQGRYAEAEPLYERAARIAEAVLGPEHPRFGTRLQNLARLYRDQGRYAEAEPLFQRALTIIEAARGTEDSHYGRGLGDLAKLYAMWAKEDEARPLYERALEILEKALGPEHPRTVKIRDELANLKQASRTADAPCKDTGHERSVAAPTAQDPSPPTSA